MSNDKTSKTAKTDKNAGSVSSQSGAGISRFGFYEKVDATWQKCLQSELLEAKRLIQSHQNNEAIKQIELIEEWLEKNSG